MPHQLLLHPLSPCCRLPLDALLRPLTEIGFIASPFMLGDRIHYRPGGEFLQLLTFLGCSPVVALGEPGATADFCHVEPVEIPAPRLMVGRNVKPPRCPHCRHRLSEAQWMAGQRQESPLALWPCPACAKEISLALLDWRHCAGVAQIFVKVWGVFEGEAVPTEALLGSLQEITGTPWSYFYLEAEGALR